MCNQPTIVWSLSEYYFRSVVWKANVGEMALARESKRKNDINSHKLPKSESNLATNYPPVLAIIFYVDHALFFVYASLRFR
jgi:hypothetical protein